MHCSLHNRSAYSFGSALSLPVQLAEFARRQGMPAIALTDLDGLYAAVGFQQACHQRGVRPIFGTELRLSEGVGVTLLARDLVGYGNLCRLISLRHLRDQLINLNDLAQHSQEVICLVGDWVAGSIEIVPRMSLATEEPGQVARDQRSATPGLERKNEIPPHQGRRNISVAPAGANTEMERPQSRGCATLTPGYCHSPLQGDKCEQLLRTLQDIFGRNLYLELTLHSPEDALQSRRRAQVADELGIAVVAASQSRCMRADQNDMLRALASIGTLTLLDRPHPDKPVGDWHLHTPAEMQRLFRRRPDALANTLKIAEQCNVALDLTRTRFPDKGADPQGAMQRLRELCISGCRRRYVEHPPQRGMGGKRPTLREALARLDRELTIIEQVGYAGYFLVFNEIVEYCRGAGIATLARGSAADSLVCYALGVSHACPFRFDLPFDRFLNPERAKFSKMADIDLDLPWDQREQVIEWVYDRWGHDRVAMIGSPNTFHARAAVGELGRVFGLPPHEAHRATRLLPHRAAWKMPEQAVGRPEARELPANEEPYRTILQMAVALEGLPRHWAMHPCGLVVSPEPLTDLVPVQRSPKGPLVAQYDMDAIEDLGFIKIDLLGQAGLSVLRDAVAEINRTERGNVETSKHRNVETKTKTSKVKKSKLDLVTFESRKSKVASRKSNSFSREVHPSALAVEMRERMSDCPIDLDREVDYSDTATWEMIASGGARGVHHIESPAMTSLVQQCNCRDIDCLTAVVAIIRPGAANQGKKEHFARRHQGLESASYPHPSLVGVLEKTYGLMVFEEHILQIAVEFAGMDLGRADVLRRALNKQKQDLIAELKEHFVACALRKGRESADIQRVWQLVEGFAGFMFNRAHSAEYAVEAFQGAWLKRRWPAHYMAAVLSNYRGFYASSPTMPQILYVLEAMRLGARFLPPCVNRSRRRFSVEDGNGNSTAATGGGRYISQSPTCIRIPVSHIRGLSQGLIDNHWRERMVGPFESLADFVERCRPGEADANLLLDSGALDCLGTSRPAMFWELRRLVRQKVDRRGMLWNARSTDHAAPPIELTEPDPRQVATREMELFGFPISIDPLAYLSSDERGRSIDWSRYVPVNRLQQYARRRVSICGLMVADRINATLTGDLMKFVTLADRTGFVETCLFPDAYRRFGHLTAAHPILEATGIVEPFENGNGFTFRVQRLEVPGKKQNVKNQNVKIGFV